MPHQDRTLARLASSSHGVVTRAQLIGAGLSLDEIRHRLHSGVLLREYRGVYRVGHRAPSVEALLAAPPSMPEVTAPTERRVEPASGRYVDCRWVGKRLTVELDGYRFHGSRHAWELDRRREREAYARGDDTYGDVFEEPESMLRELRSVRS